MSVDTQDTESVAVKDIKMADVLNGAPAANETPEGGQEESTAEKSKKGGEFNPVLPAREACLSIHSQERG
jgi:hypothetical protein